MMRLLTVLCAMVVAGGLLPSAGLGQTVPSAPSEPVVVKPQVAPDLPLFGEELLSQGLPTASEALDRAINARNYRLGPGDRLTISIWRSSKPPNQFDVLVPPEGQIFLPTIGEILVAGRTLAELKTSLTGHLAKRLPGFQASLILTGLRSFRVLVMGEVNRPGFITANAVTRLSEVVAAARINSIGSIRAIQVRDSSGRATTTDLYNFLARGQLSENPLLADDQKILVSRQFGLVQVRGAVGRPGRYEIKRGETLKDLLTYAGGPNNDAYLQKAELSRLRVEHDGAEDRTVISVNLEGVLRQPASDNVRLSPGDVLMVYSLSFFRGGKVRITGQVRNPGDYELVSHMHLRDLLFRSGGLLPDANLERVQLERTVERQRVVMAINLATLLLEGDESLNIRLQLDDTIIVPSLLALARVVFVEGRVRRPGGYAWRENETVSTLLLRAGGAILEEERPESGGSEDAQAASAQPLASADLRTAYIQRDAADGRKTRVPVDLHRLIVTRESTVDVRLQPGDVLVVPARIEQVYVQGVVEKPGAFRYELNRGVRHYLGLAVPAKSADVGKVLLRRWDGSFANGLDTIVQPGDIIIVPEKRAWEVLNVLGILVPFISLILGR